MNTLNMNAAYSPPSVKIASESNQPFVKKNRLGDLQAFQARIAAKIADAQTLKAHSPSLLMVQVGGYSVHIPLTDISTLLTMPSITAVPLAKRWLKGLAVVQAQVLTVLDFAYCLQKYLDEHMPDFVMSKYATNFLSENSKESAALATKLLVINPLVQAQLGLEVDKILGIVSRDALLVDDQYAQYNSKLPPAIKRITIDDKALVYIELSLSEMLKSETIVKLSY